MKKRILLVEDDPGSIDVMQQELVLLGYEVTLAKNGEEAMELVASQHPDLIVMDVVLPKMDGLEAASRIRQDSRTQAIPILAATAKAMPGDRERCLAGGCDDYIAKPFSHRELGYAIEKLLKKQSERASY
ncbi:MAG: response regulator [Candidatus Binatia bacterium]